MSKRDPLLLIEDILESAHRILEYTSSMELPTFLEDRKTIDAVIRNFEIIGEAANRLPEDFKEKYSGIDWQRIKGFRNRLVHEYFGVDNTVLWLIKEKFLPDMIEQLNAVRGL